MIYKIGNTSDLSNIPIAVKIILSVFVQNGRFSLRFFRKKPRFVKAIDRERHPIPSAHNLSSR